MIGGPSRKELVRGPAITDDRFCAASLTLQKLVSEVRAAGNTFFDLAISPRPAERDAKKFYRLSCRSKVVMHACLLFVVQCACCGAVHSSGIVVWPLGLHVCRSANDG